MEPEGPTLRLDGGALPRARRDAQRVGISKEQQDMTDFSESRGLPSLLHVDVSCVCDRPART